MRIGILGGTFNPIHNGHIKMARAALGGLKLDKIIFMPCFIPPHKSRADIASPEDRLEMVRLATERSSEFETSDYEISRGGTSFSVSMLRDFKENHPDDEVFFIVGSDSYLELATWKDYSQIPKLATLAVVKRPHYNISSLDKGTALVEMEPSPISSSDVRRTLKRKSSIENMVPKKVGAYIARKKLYA